MNLNSTFWVADIGAMRITAKRSLLVWSAGLYIILVAIVIIVFGFSIPLALIGGLLAIAGHWLACGVHHYGHFRAAQMVGYPMERVTFWGLLATDIYPKNEPQLSGTIHIRRALGGPIASLLFAIATGILSMLLYFTVGEAAWFVYFLFLDTLFIFAIGAFVPLNMIGIETDGSTLIKWWGK